jgi:phosphatidylserine/phosphatidylglycerophosphate/cardiolipin synthase-like enzyme
MVIIGKEFPVKVIPYIDDAKHSLDVIVFDWRWYPQDPGSPAQLFNQAFVRALRRGVAVRAIVNNDDIASRLNALGAEARRLKTKNLVHCKLMLIDKKTVIVGSHNYTQSAFTQNLELSVVFEAPDAVLRIDQFFDNIWIS